MCLNVLQILKSDLSSIKSLQIPIQIKLTKNATQLKTITFFSVKSSLLKNHLALKLTLNNFFLWFFLTTIFWIHTIKSVQKITCLYSAHCTDSETKLTFWENLWRHCAKRKLVRSHTYRCTVALMLLSTYVVYTENKGNLLRLLRKKGAMKI